MQVHPVNNAIQSLLDLIILSDPNRIGHNEEDRYDDDDYIEMTENDGVWEAKGD